MHSDLIGVLARHILFLIAAVAPYVAPHAALAEPDIGANGVASLQEQRAGMWTLFESVVAVRHGGQKPPLFEWFNEAEVFAANDMHSGKARLPFPGLPIGASAAAELRLAHHGDAPLITFVHYNPAAYRHVRQHRLQREERLQAISRVGQSDATFPQMKTIPAFPPTAAVSMTGWWPVDAKGLTPLPVWDAAGNVPKPGGNNYTSWKRAVAVTAPGAAERAKSAELVFAGRVFANARRVRLADMVHLRLDRAAAAQLMEDTGSRKAAVLVLGRPLQAGDYLALVAFHVFAAASPSGAWATFWWHDRPAEGPHAQGRPAGVEGAWRNYLMDVAFDAVHPREPDGSPRICFNPWFEAKFPESSLGSGVTSNCVNCHSRASYPTISFLPIRRGEPDRQNDPAFAEGRLRTGLLWSLANPSLASEQTRHGMQED